MNRSVAALILIALYVLHQDIWFWRDVRPLVFGFLPVGLFYHAAYTVLIALVLLWLLPALWPAELERSVDHAPASRSGDA
jgi:hypothetical protein